MALREVATSTVAPVDLKAFAAPDAASVVATTIGDADVSNPAVVVAIVGDADVFNLSFVVDSLSRAITDCDGPVVVDLARTEFIDAGTLRALGRASLFLESLGRTLTVRSPSKLALRVLALLDLDHLVEPVTP